MRNYLAFDLGASSGKLFSGACDGERLRLRSVFSFPNARAPGAFAGGGRRQRILRLS